VSVHDGWTSSRHSTACRHALCTAHHLRELPFVDEVLQQGGAGPLKQLLRQLHATVAQARAGGAVQVARGARDRLVSHYEALLGEGLAQHPQPPPPSGAQTPPGQPARSDQSRPRRRGRRKQTPVRNLLDRLWTYEHEALRFLDDFAVPFDNNLRQ
jgi:transposase